MAKDVIAVSHMWNLIGSMLVFATTELSLFALSIFKATALAIYSVGTIKKIEPIKDTGKAHHPTVLATPKLATTDADRGQPKVVIGNLGTTRSAPLISHVAARHDNSLLSNKGAGCHRLNASKIIDAIAARIGT